MESSVIREKRLQQGKCYTCGAELKAKGRKLVCPFCGREYSKINESNDELVSIIEDIVDKRNAERDFVAAYNLCEDKIRKYPDCIELYWQAILAQFGVVYVGEEGEKKKPVFFKIKYDKKRNQIQGSYYYNELIKRLGNEAANSTYTRQAQELDAILNKTSELVEKEKKDYKVFICFKKEELMSGYNGVERKVKTKDCEKAEELYNKLQQLGYETFFSPISIEQNQDAQGKLYEPKILQALQSSRVMVLFGSRTEYIKSTWVETEWLRYKLYIDSGERDEKSLIYMYADEMPSLPASLTREANGIMDRQLVNFDYNSGYPENVIGAIKNIVKSSNIITPAIIGRQIIKKTVRAFQTVQLKGFTAIQTADFGLDKNLRWIEEDIKADTAAGYKRGASDLKKLKKNNPESGKIAALEIVIECKAGELSKLPGKLLSLSTKVDREYFLRLFNKIAYVIDHADNENFYKEFLRYMYECIFQNIDNPQVIGLFDVVKNRRYVDNDIDLRKENIKKIMALARGALNDRLFKAALEQLELPDDLYKSEIMQYARKALKQGKFASATGFTGILLKLDNSNIEAIDIKNLAAAHKSDWTSYFQSVNGYYAFGEGQIFKEPVGFLESNDEIDAYLDAKFDFMKGGLNSKTEAAFIRAFDNFLGLYRNEGLRKKRIEGIANYAGEVQCFNAGLHYCKFLVTNSDKEQDRDYDAQIYWKMTLYSFHTNDEQGLYMSTEDIGENDYYKLAYQKASSDFFEKINSIRNKQKEAAKRNRGSEAEKNKKARNKLLGKISRITIQSLLIALPIFIMIASACILFEVTAFSAFWNGLAIGTNPLTHYFIFTAATVIELIVLTVYSKRKESKFKPFPLVFVAFSAVVLVSGYYLKFSLLSLFFINLAEIILFIIFFIGIKRMSPLKGFDIITVVGSIILVIGVVILGYFNLETLFLNLRRIGEMVAQNTASGQYYESIIADVKLVYIVGAVLLVGVALISAIKNARKGKKSSLVTLLACMGAMMMFSFIVDLIIGLYIPENIEDVYSPLPTYLSIAGAFILSLLGYIYYAIVGAISRKVDK